MSLLNLEAVTLAYGSPPLLDAVSFAIERGERLCLLGRNGAGKSSLLRLVAGEISPDDGQIRRAPGLRVTALPQEIPRDRAGSVFDQVAEGLGELGGLVREYFHLTHHLEERLEGTDAGPDPLARLAWVQQQLEDGGGWLIEQRVERMISRLGLDAESPFEKLSGGQQRRVLLARALVAEPDLLLLDEPTNHLDIESIDWLEEFLLEFAGALLFVTHDRRFLRRIATRILELDRGRLTDWPGDHANYLRRREERLHAEAQAAAQFDRRLAEEEVWIRQGIKARRTRNEGRVRALEAMRDERRARREQTGAVRLRLGEADRSGKLVAEAEDVSHAWGDRPVARDFSALVLRGDRIGILGPNGIGKSTLIRLLLGDLTPDRGQIRRGTNLRIAYFDQLRDQLDPERSVRDNVADGADQVEIDGVSRHVLSYLKDFLFTPERARQPVKSLSGGERNRLLLARLFTRPANLLVLDEPTNDLDIETLELLEELLLGFQGTLLLVSHDRDLLDHVVTSTLAFEGEGRIREYVGGYSDWLRQRPAAAGSAAAVSGRGSGAAAPGTGERSERQRGSGKSGGSGAGAETGASAGEETGRRRGSGKAAGASAGEETGRQRGSGKAAGAGMGEETGRQRGSGKTAGASAGEETGRQRGSGKAAGTGMGEETGRQRGSGKTAGASAGAKRLTFAEARELEGLPARIEALEQEQTELHRRMTDAAFYRQDADVQAEARQRLEQLEGEIPQVYARWEALEARR